MKAWHWRLVRVPLIGAALVLLANGCVGHREARLVSSQMMQTSEKATAVVRGLNDAAQADLRAQQETRRALTTLHQTWFQNRQALALAEIGREFLRVSNRIAADLVAAQFSILEQRRKLNALLPVRIMEQVAPLEKRAEELKVKAQEAAQALDAAVGDNRLLKESAQADRAYLATKGIKIEIQRDGIQAGTLALDAAEKTAMGELADAAKAHGDKIRDLHDEGVKNVLSAKPSVLDFGPEPTGNTNSLNDLADYTESMRGVGEAMQEYFVLNSFGKGSFFDVMLRGLGQGFIKALPIIGNGKGVSWSEAGDASTALLKDLVTETKGSLKEAGDTAKGALNATLNDAVSGLTKKVQEGLDTLSAKVKVDDTANK